MPYPWLLSFIFLAVFVVVLTCGIFALQYIRKAPANRGFFALTMAVSFWSAGMSFSNVSPDVATCEFWRRFSAIGWGIAFAILLHFTLTITGNTSIISKRKKLWIYPLLYLPALVTVFVFAVPNDLNSTPYRLFFTKFGWVNVSEHNVWDWIFYAYYVGYAVASLIILLRWGRKTPNTNEKRHARIIFTAIITALALGTITDVILSSMYSHSPQIAPAIMLIPILSTYHVLQKDSFGITEPVDRKTSYMSMIVSVVFYVAASTLQIRFTSVIYPFLYLNISESSIRGIIVQIQMLLSVFLVLRENKPGYILSLLLNSINIVASVVYLIVNNATASIPGIIAYSSIIVVITLIQAYKDRNAAYIKKINTQIVKENFYSNIFRQAPVGIAILRDKSHVKSEEFDDISINPKYEQILGRGKTDLQNLT